MTEEDAPPALPKRPSLNQPEPASTPPASLSPPPPPPPPDSALDPEPISDFWSRDEAARQKAYDEEQDRLRLQREAEMQRQNLLIVQQQRDFEERQRVQAEQQRLAEEQLMRDQLARQAQGHVAELERQLLELKGQQNSHLLLLESYDNVWGSSLIMRRKIGIVKKIKKIKKSGGEKIKI